MKKNPQPSTISKVGPTFNKTLFKPVAKVTESANIETVIKENHSQNLKYDATQGVQWLENVFDTKLSSRDYKPIKGIPILTSPLGRILQDGTILVRLFNLIAHNSNEKQILTFHQTPSTYHEILENLGFVLNGVQTMQYKGTLFSPEDIIQGRHESNVLGFLEQLMKRDIKVWNKANAETVTLNVRHARNTISIKKTALVSELKNQLSELQNIPKQELPSYGVKLTTRRPPIQNFSSSNQKFIQPQKFTKTSLKPVSAQVVHVPPPESASVSTKTSVSNEFLQKSNDNFSSFLNSNSSFLNSNPPSVSPPRSPPPSSPPHSPAPSSEKIEISNGVIGSNDDFWLEENANLSHFEEYLNSDTEIALEKLPKVVNRLVKLTQDHLKAMEASSVALIPTKPPSILEGDSLQISFNNICHIHSTFLIVGDLYITKYQMVFEPSSSPATTTSQCSRRGFRVPLAAVESLAKCAGVTSRYGKFFSFEIRCKDFHDVRFSYLHSKKGAKSSSAPVSDLLQKYLFPNTPQLFAFSRSDFIQLSSKAAYYCYDFQREFNRLGIPNEHWSFSNINLDYSQSQSYPNQIVVPTGINESDLKAVFKYRSKGRIPVLNWIHPKTNASLTRCSQPAMGLTGKVCKEDERVFTLIRNSNGSKELYIVDARPKLNAMANQVKGMGYEKSSEQLKVLFLNIDNIHVMRKALNKLRKVCLDESNKQPIHQRSEATKWLQFSKLILTGGVAIATLLERGYPVCVHCSDGWDRTPQLTCVAQLLLDPYFRTIEGFIVLVEKEWLSFGHKFDQRVGHTNSNFKDSERAPIFWQFIDCVWQLWAHFPSAFEFNSYFLRLINTHLISCCFGTFLFNCESERAQARLGETAPSLWQLILNNKSEFTNKFFSPVSTLLTSKIDWPLQVWEEFYLYWKIYHQDKSFEK